MPPLNQAKTTVIFSLATTTLLLLRNKQVPLYQSSNLVLSPSNHSRSGTIALFRVLLLYAAGAGAVDILSVTGIAGSVLLFNMLSSVILNDPSISSNASIASVLCLTVLATLFLHCTSFAR